MCNPATPTNVHSYPHLAHETKKHDTTFNPFPPPSHTLLYTLSIKDVGQDLEAVLHSNRFGLAYHSSPFRPVFHYLLQLPVGHPYQVPADYVNPWQQSSTWPHTHTHTKRLTHIIIAMHPTHETNQYNTQYTCA